MSPLPLQKGAKIVAEYSNIAHVILSPSSTISDYLMQFLNQVFIGVSDTATVTEGLHFQFISDGRVIEER